MEERLAASQLTRLLYLRRSKETMLICWLFASTVSFGLDHSTARCWLAIAGLPGSIGRNCRGGPLFLTSEPDLTVVVFGKLCLHTAKVAETTFQCQLSVCFFEEISRTTTKHLLSQFMRLESKLKLGVCRSNKCFETFQVQWPRDSDSQMREEHLHVALGSELCTSKDPRLHYKMWPKQFSED